MTIETATPSSLETLAGMFDTLVEHVAARVLFKLDASIATHVEHAMDTWAMTSGTLEDKITEGVQSFVDTQLDLDDVVKQALDNLDLDDMVMSAAQDLTFEVSVSR
jgi:homoserine acetyltransferase